MQRRQPHVGSECSSHVAGGARLRFCILYTGCLAGPVQSLNVIERAMV